MRLIPGKTKVKIELFRGITLWDVIVGVIVLALITLVIMSTLPWRIYIALGVLAVGVLLELRLDDMPNYELLMCLLRYSAYPRRFVRDAQEQERLDTVRRQLRTELQEMEAEVESDTFDPEALRPEEPRSADPSSEKAAEASSDAPQTNPGTTKQASAKPKRSFARKTGGKSEPIEDVCAFTGISDGFIEYAGRYYGVALEIEPVEFRFFSEYRRNNVIENCMGKILRSLREDYAANIVKIERPIIYDEYLDKEYEKLYALRDSFEKGFLTEEELQSRVEIQYDRINAMRELSLHEMVIQPFYYVVLFNKNKQQLSIDANMAAMSLLQGEVPARRLMSDKELAVFLKYTNYLDFNEKEIDKLDPKDYAAWARPDSVSFTMRTAKINGIVTHQLRAISFPMLVGDAWLAGVMSIPSTKVVVKVTPMDRTKSIRTIDRSLQELRGQYEQTSVDSKLIELQGHIETLSNLLVTLQQENESLLTVNIYVTMYDAVRTAETGGEELVKHTNLTAIGDMKKTVRRSWTEAGMKLSSMDFEQLQGFIGSQISAYDPKVRDGRGMPSNTVAATFPWIYATVSDPGGIRLGTQDGVPVFIDFFRRDSERVNSNMVIIGKSGSGKSYGTKSILTNLASEDAKIFILDPENEYSELAHNLHGKVINVGNASLGRLNPFHIITALEDDEAGAASVGGSFSTHLQFLEEFFRQILPDTDKEALEYLNTLVERMYSDFHITPETDLSKLTANDYPIFDDLYDIVLEEFQRTNNEYLRTMLHTLMNSVSKFARGGRNANIWDGPSTITTEENFSVFNFQSLLANRNTTIANAQMLLVLKYVDNEIIKNREYNRKYGMNRKIVVVIDEAHVFIDTKFPVALDFMFQLAKRIRKYNGMQIVITQNIKDFVGSEEIARKSTAIINACQYSFIFGLAPNDMDDLCRLYEKAGGINEMEQEQIITAPRGQTFAIMSPTSRSSFTVTVPEPMVQMFEQPDYITRYFSGEEGYRNWEDFVAECRTRHDASLSERMQRTAAEQQAATPEKRSRITFEEISGEDMSTMADAVSGSGNVQFEEITMHPERADQGVMVDETSASRTEEHTLLPEPEDAQPVLLMPDDSPVSLPDDEPQDDGEDDALTAYAEDEEDEEEDYDQDFDDVDDDEEFDFSFGQDSDDDDEDFGFDLDTDDDEIPDFDTQSDEDGEDDEFEPKFDIMSILDEQLNSYMEMSLPERMEEINVNTMEITLEDLDAYIKSLRKKRR